ncbi:MAG: hypothetical protein U0984_08195, partial [Prosthecobacter sp.]|nr:hypothetical protein [Prosthecobacter sp.]
MKLTLKILGWVAMAAFIVVAILVIDVQHAVKHSCRVKIDDDVLATAILARFPFEPYYLSKVVDNVPQSGW